MAQLHTVRGPIDTADLGTTLMHEHVFVLTADVQRNFPAEWGSEDERVAGAASKLQALVDLGVETIVDPTVVGLGRDIARIQRVNERVDLNIVVATGIYTYDNAPFFFRHRGPGVLPDLPEPMVDLFVGDLTVGIAGTGVRAAFLKCAIDAPGLTPDVERIMRAVAKAHLETGAPITVHTHPRTQAGLEAKRVLEEEGVDPRHVVLGHSGDTTDADHLQVLADAGYLLGMDRFGLEVEMSFDERVGVVAELCRRGYAASMVLSHDACCYIDWLDPANMVLFPNWHYAHIHQQVLPALRAAGVSDDDIETMLVTNPRRYFEGSGGQRKG